MAALQYADIPGYSALILRKHSIDLYKSKGFIDTAEEWLSTSGADWNGQRKRWTFPTSGQPAILEFGHFDAKASEKGKFGVSGTTYQYIGVDELTEFDENEFKFLNRSLRRTADSKVPIRLRAGTNPLGPGAAWVKQYFIVEGAQNGRIFMPSKIDDNKFLDRDEYIKTLQNLDPYTRAQLLDGDWDAKPPGKMFRREWFKLINSYPPEAQVVRAWDLAATEEKPGKDPSWTVGVKMALYDGRFYIIDVQRMRGTPKAVEDLIKQTARLDGVEVDIGMEQEGGSSGVNVIDYYTRELNRYTFHGYRSTGSKATRAKPFATQVEAGNVYMVMGTWINKYLDELEQQPGGSHDDQMDGSSLGYWMLVNEDLGGAMDDVIVGGDELPQPDWNNEDF
jgi:predicted phage terminase large subunit-like protein